MLVLTQKANDKIHIGNNITVTILRVKGRVVKVGIEAPVDIQVLRDALVAAVPTIAFEGEMRKDLHNLNHLSVRKPR
jgi:carbon storage regulator CsrA